MAKAGPQQRTEEKRHERILKGATNRTDRFNRGELL